MIRGGLVLFVVLALLAMPSGAWLIVHHMELLVSVILPLLAGLLVLCLVLCVVRAVRHYGETRRSLREAVSK